MLLNEFVDCFGDLDREGFLERFPHPFLLAKENPDAPDRGRAVFMLRGAQGSALIIGRGARCHIRIKDPLVSTMHAELIPPSSTGAFWRITDRGSTNKTFVGGEELAPNEPVPLEDRAELTFGIASHYVFLTGASFFDEVEPVHREREQREPMTTDVIGPAAEVREAIEEAAEPEDSDPDLAGELLLFCDTLDPIPLPVGARLVVGRKAQTADVVLPNKEVSRRHAELERRDNGWVYVRDMGSSNGTFVGNRKVRKEWIKLRPGRILKISSYRLRLDQPQLEGSDRVKTLTSKEVETSLEDMSLPDILQHIEDSKETGILRVVSGKLKGQIGFGEGVPLYAATSDGLQMEEAILRLLREKEGTCKLLKSERASGERKMTRTFSEILLEEFLTEG